ncbi:MAG: hypothetical protein G01um101418_466 [Parcubacteria group bacterium Gr01-1014_18]|nr:MAG: hypothetical protein Greene041636_512 [Parcubacteria group bacterium Greene0416_36]TSC81053.1 MAG: hypothetical protein G01um101418_466 [Parcubacteria group bacterium Gr01-1014_18]TSC98787.1 MAG: hypothetical protein Greene101420_537 [Parcubacteria group bacterium Greene1014_20]TSD06733.1 MAG: hypothetical protein Greene07142_654 [Parcubacteria group bacterium Greene0714_2]
MKILVIDDNPANRESAIKTLEGHIVTICASVKEAFLCLGNEDIEFDAVLTALFLQSRDFSVDYIPPQDYARIPAGLAFAILAANRRIRTVIVMDYCQIVSYGEREPYWLVSLRQLAGWGRSSGSDKKGLVYCICEDQVSAPMHPDLFERFNGGDFYLKNWLTVMERSDLFPELLPYTNGYS